jgi:hypothetical protein
MLESPESLSGNLKGLSGVTSDIEPLIQPLNITSDIAGSLATALPTGALARPKQSEEKEEFENEGKQARSDFPSNSKPAQPSSPHPPNSARPPSPQAKPGEELAAALERLGNGVRANGGNLTVGSSDVTRAMHWQ